MKQKVKNQTPITKAELTKTLKYYPTKEDLKAAEKKLKEELIQAQARSNNKLDKKFVERFTKGQAASRAESDYKFSLMQENLDAKFSKFTNLILTAIDPLLKELKTRQQEREIVAGQITRVEGDVENLKKRVTKLEHS